MLGDRLWETAVCAVMLQKQIIRDLWLISCRAVWKCTCGHRTRSQLWNEKASMSSFILKSKSRVGRSSIWEQKRSRSPVFECVFCVFRGDLSSHWVAEGCSPKVVAARQRNMENSGHRAAKRVTLCHWINTRNSTKRGVFARRYGHWLPFRLN